MIIRWILFVPAVYLLTCAVYLFAAWVAVSFPWWGALILFSIGGMLIRVLGIAPVVIAPNHVAGCWIFIGFIVIGGLIEAPEMISIWPGRLIFWRLVADLLMIKGALDACAAWRREQSVS